MARPARQPRHDELYLWYLADPTAPRLAGQLKLMHAAGKGVSLTYDPTWLADGFALSEDLPLRRNEFIPRPRLAAGAVDDARPDRWGERVIQYVDNPTRLSLMEYLYYAGDDRYGALGVSPSRTAYQPRKRGPLPRLKDAQLMSDVVQKINANEALSRKEQALIHAGGSFGGAKPKALVSIEGEQWIIKFFNDEPVDLPLIEHATMNLARQAGIRSADTAAVRLMGGHAVVVRRFDRDGAMRLHSISAATALRGAVAVSVEPELSYPALAELLRRTGDPRTREADAVELYRRMVFNILVDNTDDHEKNHALLVPAPNRVRLALAYDVAPTHSGQGVHEFAIGEDGKTGSLANAISQCSRFGLTPDTAARHIQKVIEVVDPWKGHFKRCGVSRSDIDQLAERIDADDLLNERRHFKAPQHVSRTRKRPLSPFAPKP